MVLETGNDDELNYCKIYFLVYDCAAKMFLQNYFIFIFIFFDRQ
jgi:hypothetical protein